MRRLLQITFSIIIVIGLAGCSGASGTDATGKKTSKLEQQVASVVSMTIVTAATNKSVTLTDSASIERLIKAIKETQYSPGQLDISGADYTVTLEVKDGTSRVYSWWLGDKYAGLMTVTDQVGHYKLPESTKQDLLQLFG